MGFAVYLIYYLISYEIMGANRKSHPRVHVAEIREPKRYNKLVLPAGLLARSHGLTPMWHENILNRSDLNRAKLAAENNSYTL